jgi:hypothetical protein
MLTEFQEDQSRTKTGARLFEIQEEIDAESQHTVALVSSGSL